MAHQGPPSLFAYRPDRGVPYPQSSRIGTARRLWSTQRAVVSAWSFVSCISTPSSASPMATQAPCPATHGALLAGKNMVLPRQGVPVHRDVPGETRRRCATQPGGHDLRATGVDPETLLRDTADGDYLMWAYVAHRDTYPADVAAHHGRSLRDLIAGRAASWHGDLRRVIADSDPGSVAQFAFSAAAPSSATDSATTA